MTSSRHEPAPGAHAFDESDLSPAEREFRELLSRPAAYAAWASEVRLAWERNNVLWFHGYRNGKAIWRPERPKRTDEPPRFARRGAPQQQEETPHT